MKKTYMMPSTDVLKVRIERLLNTGSEIEADLHDDDPVDDPNDLLSREHDRRKPWADEEELEEEDLGNVSY